MHCLCFGHTSAVPGCQYRQVITGHCECTKGSLVSGHSVFVMDDYRFAKLANKILLTSK